MCLTGAVIAYWSLTWEVAGWSPFNDKYFCHWIRWIQWKDLGKTLLTGMFSRQHWSQIFLTLVIANIVCSSLIKLNQFYPNLIKFSIFNFLYRFWMVYTSKNQSFMALNNNHKHSLFKKKQILIIDSLLANWKTFKVSKLTQYLNFKYMYYKPIEFSQKIWLH